jgi:NADPH:quinone reductase-like Zn-dependent oxidoreductase
LKVLRFATYGGPEVLHVSEQPMPEPGPGEVLVRVHAATVGWGDCKLRAGLLQNFYRVTLPKIPGRYGSGTIAAVGSDVKDRRIGEAVIFAPPHTQNGSAAEYVAVASENVAGKPENLDHVQVASIIQGATSAYACLIEAGQLSPGQHVLIQGAAGSAGSACTELARHLGAVVSATCREVDRDYVRLLGADHVIAFDKMDFSETVRDQDIVVDLIGGEVHRRSYRVIRPGGRLVYLHAAPIDAPAQSSEFLVVNAVVKSTGELLGAVSRLIAQNVLRPKVGKVLALEEGALAHTLLEARAIKRGRIVLAVS